MINAAEMENTHFDKKDKKFMRLALNLAQKGLGYTNPNPAVGAVIVKDNEVVGKGWHKKAGQAHAEVNAIKDAGDRTKGATIYVTLEPCNHTGKTPPCTQAIMDAGIRRVVVGATDPNPKVKGGGLQFLKEQGVEVAYGLLEKECRLLIAPFSKHMKTGLPWVRAKVASSLDGRVATRTGHSKWITNEKARAFGQRLRQWSDAILVGKGTVIADDPALTFRRKGWPAKRLLRIVVDSRLSLPANLNVFNVSVTSPTLVATVKGTSHEKRRRLEAKGVEVLELSPDDRGLVDTCQLVEILGKRGVQALLVEGGAKIHGSFWDQNLVDEAFFFFAPMVIGGTDAPSSVAGTGVEKVTEAPRLSDIQINRFGDNLLIRGTVTDMDVFWRQ